MYFKKCERCGCFFTSNDCICPNCAPKDKFEMSKLKDFFEDNNQIYSIEYISENTGISSKNLNRYLKSEDFSSYAKNLENIGINL